MFNIFLCCVQIKLSHQRPLAAETPLSLVMNSPAWTDSVSPSTWYVLGFCFLIHNPLLELGLQLTIDYQNSQQLVEIIARLIDQLLQL